MDYIHVITWITEVETIKRQTGTVCSCLAVRLARVCGLSLQPIGCTSSLACDEQRYGSCSCRLWRYISVMPLRFNCCLNTATTTATDAHTETRVSSGVVCPAEWTRATVAGHSVNTCRKVPGALAWSVRTFVMV